MTRVTRLVRCKGSNYAPASVHHDRAECPKCHQRFALKLNGKVRKHTVKISASITARLTYPITSGKL